MGGALELLAVERGLLSAAELTRLKGGRPLDPLVLAGHLVALGRVRPEYLAGLMAEAEALAGGPPPAPSPSRPELPLHERLTVIDDGPPLVPPAPLREQQTLLDPREDGPSRVLSTVSEEEPARPPEERPEEPEERQERGAQGQIGRYQLLEELGRGAMGVVHRVRLAGSEQEYALKVLHTSSPGRLQRFQEELRLLLRLNHPHLVRIRDGGTDRGRPWFVMDLVPGRDLRDVLKERELSPQEAARVVRDVARALAHAHEHGVLHRDLKPENIRVDRDLVPTIIDFGLAKDLETSSGLTRTGASIGTPYYMAPEQAAGRNHEVDVRTDVWGLGVVLYELLTNDVPFQARSSDGLARLIVSAPPRPLRETGRQVPPALEAVCMRALAKPREERWPGAGDMADALDAFLQGQAEVPHPRRSLALMAALVTLVTSGLALSLLAWSARDERAPEVAEESGAAGPASATPPGDGLKSGSQSQTAEHGGDGFAAARARARAGGPALQEAAALLGAPDEPSFLRAEQAALLARPDAPGAAGLRLLLAAEAGAAPRATPRVLELLGQGPSDSPALAEARARAALLAHDAQSAAQAAQEALSGAPGDPLALRIAARAEAAALEPEEVRLLGALVHSGGRDAAAAAALAARWESIAGQLTRARELERDQRPADEARLWAAHAWTRAHGWRLLEGAGAGARLHADWDAARAELEPLLTLVPAARLSAARRALGGALARGGEAELEAAEEALARAAWGGGSGLAEGCPRGEAALGAVRLAAALGGPDGRLWAEAWLGLAGDLPARALLALAQAAASRDLLQRQRHLQRAGRLAPQLPLVVWGKLHLGPRGELGALGSDASALLARAKVLAAAPELGPLVRAPLEAAPLGPLELASVLEGLPGSDRDTRLARALARLHARVEDRSAEGRAAAADAAAAAALDPACAAAHLLEGEGLALCGGDPLPALERACAAAPGGPEGWRVRLQLQPSPPVTEELEPLLLQGWVVRLGRLLERGGREVPLPERLSALLDAPGLDLDQFRSRLSFLGGLEREQLCPLVCLDLRLSGWGRGSWRSRASFVPGAGRAPRLEEWLPRGLAQLSGSGPERWAAEAEGCAREQERRLTPAGRRAELRGQASSPAVRALLAASPAGGDPWPARDQLRAAGVLPPTSESGLLLPDAPELGWTWYQALRRPDLQLARVVALVSQPRDQTGSPGALRLSGDELSWPLGPTRALLEAIQVSEVQQAGAVGLLTAREVGEAGLALARAAAFVRDGDPAEAWCEHASDLSQAALYGAHEPSPEELELLASCLEEGLLRWGHGAEDRAVLQGQRADLFLWQAGRVGGEARQRLLEQAAVAVGEADPQLIGSEEPTFWSPWRRARLHAARGETAAAVEAVARAQEALDAPGGRFLGDAPRRAVLRDPLRPLLEPIAGYAQLLEAVTPRQ